MLGVTRALSTGAAQPSRGLDYVLLPALQAKGKGIKPEALSLTSPSYSLLTHMSSARHVEETCSCRDALPSPWSAYSALSDHDKQLHSAP